MNVNEVLKVLESENSMEKTKKAFVDFMDSDAGKFYMFQIGMTVDRYTNYESPY